MFVLSILRVRPAFPPAFFQKDGQPPAALIPKRSSHASTARNASGHPFRIRPSGTHGPICGSLAPPKQKWLSGRATIRILAGHRCHAVAIKTPSFPSLASRTPPFGTKTSPGESFVAEGQNSRRQQPIPVTIEPPRYLPLSRLVSGNGLALQGLASVVQKSGKRAARQNRAVVFR